MRHKKRHSSKTGGTYQSQSNQIQHTINNSKDHIDSEQSDDDDPMYSKVDLYHNTQESLKEDLLRFDADENSVEDDGVTEGIEPVLDLGLSGDEDEEGEEDTKEEVSVEYEDASLESSSSEEEGKEVHTNIMNWGKRKGNYYHGDTADLEIGQESEDASVEEHAASEVLNVRYEQMDESDFLIDTSKSQDINTTSHIEIIGSQQKNVPLSTKDTVNYLQKSHPELLPLLQHFKNNAVTPLEDTLSVVDVLFEDEDNIKAIGITPQGKEYMLTKTLLQLSLSLNLCQYLLLKAHHTNHIYEDNWGLDEGTHMTNHPVILRLNSLEDWRERLNVLEGKLGLGVQLNHLVDAVKLMRRGELEKEIDDEENDDVVQISISKREPECITETESSESEKNIEDEELQLMTDSRFGVRVDDDTYIQHEQRKVPIYSDFGEDDVDEKETKEASRVLSKTLNIINQRTQNENPKMGPEEEDSDDGEYNHSKEVIHADVNYNQLVGLEEQDLGKGNDELQRGLKLIKADVENIDDDDQDLELNYNSEKDGFYERVQKRSKARKSYKKKKYEVAPKYPTWEEEYSGERKLQSHILRNRGLVPHKSKLNRNPRAKKREQYRKALIRRKGVVRDVRTGEVDRYAGEATGVKKKVVHSRQLV